MNSERFQSVRDLFDRACELPVDARRAFLERECAQDRELLDHVSRLLATVDEPSPVLQASPAAPLRAALDLAWNTATRAVPQRIGPYHVITQIGQGGMGSVYEARQENPARSVAVKVMRADNTSPEALRRFVHEAHVLGRLRHPGIAHIYEAGVAQTPDGPRPYIAMELIHGVPLIAHAHAAGLDTQSRIALFVKVCEAFDHAHQAGVVHRDIKPSNILVDELGQPKIVDFGVAAAQPADGPGAPANTMHTRAGQVIGTLSYMSPEQIAGDSGRVSARSDVYSLGVVLFELLAGRLPLDLRERSLPESARVVRDEEPSRLSAINTNWRGDLDTIVTKCLEKDPARRYATAGTLAADLVRYLTDEPILARPPTKAYQLRKFARRHRELVLGVTAAFVILIAGIIATSWTAVQAQRERTLAQSNEARARWESYRNVIAAADRALQAGDTAAALRTLETAPLEHRSWEWQYLHAACDASLLTLQAHTGSVAGVAVSPPLDAIFSLGSDGQLRRWNIKSATPTWSVSAHTQGTVLILAQHLLITQGKDGGISAWHAHDGALAWSMAPPAGASIGALSTQSLSPDLTTLAVPIASRIAFVDAATGRETHALALPFEGASTPAFSSSGSLLSCVLRAQCVVFNLTTQAEIARIPPDTVAWSGHADRLWQCSVAARTLTAFEVISPRTLEAVETIHAVATLVPVQSRDVLAGLSFQGGVFFVPPPDDNSAPRIMPLRGPAESLTAAASMGARIVTGDREGVVRLWTMTPGADRIEGSGSNDIVISIAVSPDGDVVATSGWGSVKFWNAQTGDELRTVFPLEREIERLVFNGSGDRLFAFGGDMRLVALDPATGQTIMTTAPLGERVNIPAMDWSGPAGLLAATTDSPMLFLIDPQSGAIRRTCTFPDANLTDVIASPADPSLAVTDRTGNIWTLALTQPDAQPVMLLEAGKPSQILRRFPIIAFDRTGARLIAVRRDGTIALIDMTTRTPLWRRPSFALGPVISADFSTDGSRLFISTTDGAVGVLDSATGDKLLTLRSDTSASSGQTFANDTLFVARTSPRAGWQAFTSQPTRDAISQHETRARISAIATRLTQHHRLVADAVAAIDHDASISPSDRPAVIALLHARGDHPNYLNSDAWAVVRFPNRSHDEYASVLRLSKRACELRPANFAFVNTLAFAHLRIGQYHEAQEAALRAIDLRTRQNAREDPTDLFVLALARLKLGDSTQALADFQRARQLMDLPRFRDDPEARWIDAEARTVFASTTSP